MKPRAFFCGDFSKVRGQRPAIPASDPRSQANVPEAQQWSVDLISAKTKFDKDHEPAYPTNVSVVSLRCTNPLVRN